MEISCAFPTALDSPDHIALAEQLGYRPRLAVRHAAAEHGRLDDARAGGRADRAHRPWAGCPRAHPCAIRWPTPRPPPTSSRSPPAASPWRSGPASRPPGDGLPRDPLGLHGRLHPRVPRPAARRDRRVGGRADAHAAPARPRRGAAGRRADHHRGAGAQGRRRRARAGRRPLHHPRAPRVRQGVLAGLVPLLGDGPRRRRGSAAPTACARPEGQGGRSPTTGPTSSGRRSRTCRAGRSGRRWSSEPRPRSATSPSTSSTASASTRRTRRPGRRAATGCSTR